MTACPCWPAMTLAQHMQLHPPHAGRGQRRTAVCEHLHISVDTWCDHMFCCSASLLGPLRTPLSRAFLSQESTPTEKPGRLGALPCLSQSLIALPHIKPNTARCLPGVACTVRQRLPLRPHC